MFEKEKDNKTKVADSLEDLLGLEKNNTKPTLSNPNPDTESSIFPVEHNGPESKLSINNDNFDENDFFTNESKNIEFNQRINGNKKSLGIMENNEGGEISFDTAFDNFIDLSQKHDHLDRPSLNTRKQTEHNFTTCNKNKFDYRGTISDKQLNEQGYFQCPPGLEKIKITRKAFEDMILVAEAINKISKERWGSHSEKLEVYMYVFADKDEIKQGKSARISSIYIPYHQAAEASVDVNTKGILDVKKYIESSGKVLLGWSHSHGHFNVYSSQTDEINHQILLNDTSNILNIPPFQLKYIYGITINDNAERFGVILTQYPCGHIERNSDEEFDIEGESYSDFEKEDRYEMFKDLINERATIIEPIKSKSKDEILNELTEELIVKFLHNLDKAKDLMYHKVSQHEESQFSLIQDILDNYDNLVLDGVEETFKVIAKKLLSSIRDVEKDI